MVIGNGLMARAFEAYSEQQDVCVFASGVSDSTADDAQAFLREQSLLDDTIAAHPSKLLVYFSTCSIEDPSVNDRPYCQHKRAMEERIMAQAPHYLICRLSHIVGAGGNKHTIFNYLIDKIRSQEQYELWVNAERNFLDVEDVALIVDDLIEAGYRNQVLNVAHPHSQSMLSLVAEMERLLEISSQHKAVKRGAPLHIDCPEMHETFSELERLQASNYISHLLAKYHHVSA